MRSFVAREGRPPERPNPKIVPTHVQRWARMTSPSLGEPGGILQKEVSEIFSFDQPAFYKHFLRLTTHRSGDLGRLDIFLHRVSGTAHSTEELVVRIDYGPTSAETATLRVDAAEECRELYSFGLGSLLERAAGRGLAPARSRWEGSRGRERSAVCVCHQAFLEGALWMSRSQ